jgi:hypothetical protein
MSESGAFPWFENHKVQILILLIGAINGVLFVFLVPPWQHYDEPSNFEYAWLLANLNGGPEYRDFNQAMRREVAASMVEHGFFIGTPLTTNLVSESTPAWIGITQTGDLPFYYHIVAVALSLVKHSDITFQLYVGRFVSLALYLVTIIVAYGIMLQLSPSGHPLRWMVPISLALHPGYTDIMTSVNNDVGATLVFSVFLYGVIFLIKHGFSLAGLLWVVTTTLLCLFTKKTVILALPLAVLAILFSIFLDKRRSYVWGASIIGGILFLVSTINMGDAASWYRITSQLRPTRVLSVDAPHGEYAFQIINQPGEPPVNILQVLPLFRVQELRGQTVTLGAWMWADKPTVVQSPEIYNGARYVSKPIELGTNPTFLAISTKISENADRIGVALYPLRKNDEHEVSVFYDAIILVIGEFQTEVIPIIIGSTGSDGLWGNLAYQNLLDNSSAEDAWPWVSKPFDDAWKHYSNISPSWIMASILDWPNTNWYYQPSMENLLRTFWAKFGWGNVLLLGNKPYRNLAIITLAGIFGAGLAIRRRRRSLPWDVLFFLGLALFGVWGATLVRGIDAVVSFSGRTFIPSARYAYPAIIPSLLLLNRGWLELMRQIDRLSPIPLKKAMFICYGLFFVGLDLLSIISLRNHFL